MGEVKHQQEGDEGAAEAGTSRPCDAFGADTVVIPEESKGGLGLVQTRELDGTGDAGGYDQVLETLLQVPAKGQKLGRYVVLGVLGEGGMGTVLEAFDRTLDRRVAVKVLHEDLDEEHTRRLLREAQAMARLSHPNVVQVYEAGEVDGQAFVAMELVQGQTLRAWMRQDPRPDWRACVTMFLQLGAGLAAAHERGLVHRDFKPGNAIIDDEGRPRVLDFGLVRKAETDRHDEPSSVQRSRTEDEEPALDITLTRTGTVLGTPAYMPPEQLMGSETDARSDQFSFCVSLYEAVYGERPFEGSSMAALMVSMKSGSVRPAPRGTQVPAALRSVLLRGLAVAAEQRWPSMEALLGELRRLAMPRRRAWWALGLAGGLTALGAAVAYQAQVAREVEDARQAELAQRCSGARLQLDGIWDEGRKQEVKAAILDTALSYAPGTWERVEQRLDHYAAAWAHEHTEVCEATTVRHEQSEQHMGLRMGCLRERRLHLRATVDELARADATVVEHAVEAVASLPGLERCADVEALMAEVPPPEDPGVAERVAKLDERLVEAKAKEENGRYAEGLAVTETVVAEATTLGYEPLMARAWLQQGVLQIDTGRYEGAVETLRKAYDAALARRMTAEAAKAASNLVFVLGSSLARHEEARRWAADADPLSRAVGTNEARANFLNNLGAVADSQGEYEAARESHEKALAMREITLGPDHPHVGTSLGNLGSAMFRQGKHQDARDHFKRALAIWENALGPDHPHVARSHNNLGVVAYSQDKHEDARDHYQRALAIRERTLGRDHPEVAMLFNNLGVVANSQGKQEDALGYYERALPILERSLGRDHPHVAMLLGNMGAVAYSQAEYEDARDYFERALVTLEKAFGPDDPSVANSLIGLGDALLGLERPADALIPLERALAIRTTHEIKPSLLAETRFALARALWTAPAARGRDRLRARTLAEQARAALVTAEGSSFASTDLAEVDAWLAEHRVR